MGYGLGVFLMAVGLILALAVQDSINGIDLVMTGWILAAAGAVVVAITLATQSAGRRSTTVTTHRDGSQTVSESNHQAPPAV